MKLSQELIEQFLEIVKISKGLKKDIIVLKDDCLLGMDSNFATLATLTYDSNKLDFFKQTGLEYTFFNTRINTFLKNAQKGDIFLTQLENPIDIIGYALKQAEEKEMLVVLNPAPANKDIKPFLKYVDILTPNEGECALLGGEEELLKEAKCLVVTLGDKGFKIIDKQINETFPCMKIKPVDTTAAGDTFCGAMLAKYSKCGDFIASAKYGSLAASITCTRKGAQPSIPTKDEICELTNNL